MSLSAISRSVQETLAFVPWSHWALIGGVTFAVAAIPMLRKQSKLYGCIALAIAVFISLMLLEATVVIRYCGFVENGSGIHLNLDLGRLREIDRLGYESLFNIIAFVPFGFFLSEFMAEAKTTGRWRRFLCATGVGLCLSLCIEILQLLLRVGFFELLDLLLNTAGCLAGAGISLLLRRK